MEMSWDAQSGGEKNVALSIPSNPRGTVRSRNIPPSEGKQNPFLKLYAWLRCMTIIKTI